MLTLTRLCVAFFLICATLGRYTPEQKRILAKAARSDEAGWIHLTLKGSPYEVGFQHGSLIYEEFSQAWETYAYFMYQTTGMTLDFFNQWGATLAAGKIPAPLLDELQGITDGLNANGVNVTLDDVIGWNANTEITGYWWPTVAANWSNAPQALGSYAKVHCSAFVATGSATADGGVVIGHETFTEFWNGQYMNVLFDITPETPNAQRMIFQGSYGWIASMTDFWINSAGLAVVETTLAGFVGYNVDGVPEWVRARYATQYATTAEEWIDMMQAGNNGGYANSWLVAELNTGLIARFEQGLRYQSITYSTDGYFYGENVAFDPRIRNLECVDTGYSDVRQQTGARRTRWPQLLNQYSGKIDLQVGQTMLGDTYDPYLQKENPSSRCICAHYDADPQYYVSDPNAVWNQPYTPAGSVDGKITTTALGLSMNVSIVFGRADGTAFDAPTFLAQNPVWAWQSPYLQSRPAQPWTTF